MQNMMLTMICTTAVHDDDVDDDDDDDVGGDDNDGNNQILVQVQIESDHIQINSSTVGRKGLDCRNVGSTKNCRNIKKTKMHQVNEMATRDRAGIYRYNHR